MHVLPPALSPLSAWPQFVCWRAEPDPSNPGKFKKFPLDWRTGRIIDAHDPQFWTTAENALAAASRWDIGYGAGGGFVFTEADPFFFHDIDRAYDRETGEWSAVAQYNCRLLAGAAVEVSHSGTGLHIIGVGKPIPHRSKNVAYDLELYTSKRFVALTGINCTGSAAADVTPGLHSLINWYFPPDVAGATASGDWTTEPVADWTGTADDEQLIAQALRSRNANSTFGTGPSFADLWECNVDRLAAWKPGEGGKPFAQSEADQTLANLLAFWTGKDCARMERLMRRSALAREKWDHHRTYLTDTILKACQFVGQVYKAERAVAQPIAPIVSSEHMRSVAAGAGRQLRDPHLEFLNPADQIEHFKGCYYNNKTGMIYSLDRNEEFTAQVFNVNYGGHVFILDGMSTAKTTSAFEAFTQSRVNKPAIVDGLLFRPEREYGEVIVDDRKVYVNSYVPHTPIMKDGDPAPFLTHLAKLAPEQHDYNILLYYLAALVQYPGRKFQWWPVIQGVEGNGKTILIEVIEYALGSHYTHRPEVSKMVKRGMSFNGWMYRKLFVGIDEIYVKDRRDFLDEFKPYVTSSRLEIENKGVNQFMGDNRANGIALTNHKAGVPISTDSRRWAVHFCPQQNERDLAAWGLDTAYFIQLFDWLKGENTQAHLGENHGFAVVAKFLNELAIPDEMNPARGMFRAPKTTSTGEAIEYGHGRAEQEVLDAAEEGREGFAGGWISSVYVDKLLEQLRMTYIPRKERAAMMDRLGYVPHPALRDLGGRTPGIVAPDHRRPVLYVRFGHPAYSISTPELVMDAYSKAQKAVVVDAANLTFGSKPSNVP